MLVCIPVHVASLQTYFMVWRWPVVIRHEEMNILLYNFMQCDLASRLLVDFPSLSQHTAMYTEAPKHCQFPLMFWNIGRWMQVQRPGSIGIKGIETPWTKWNSRERAVETCALWKKSPHISCVMYLLLSLMWLCVKAAPQHSYYFPPYIPTLSTLSWSLPCSLLCPCDSRCIRCSTCTVCLS